MPIQALTTTAGASSHNSYPIAQILTVNQPRGIFGSGGPGIAYGGVKADSPTKCILFINPTHTR